MKNFIIKYWKILIGIIFLLSLISLVISNKVKTNKIKELQTENSIITVLNDSIKTYKNKLGQITKEKLAYNVKLSELQKQFDKLDGNSQELLNKIVVLEKKNKLIEATNIHQEAVIDSLYNNKPIINEVKKTLTFSSNTKYLKYNFVVNTKENSLFIQNLILPNELYVSHSYNKSGIIVKVTNSNDAYFKTNDINAYVIPLQKNKFKLKPYVVVGGIGIGIGVVGTLFLLK